jgi:hypothetical protein
MLCAADAFLLRWGPENAGSSEIILARASSFVTAALIFSPSWGGQTSADNLGGWCDSLPGNLPGAMMQKTLAFFIVVLFAMSARAAQPLQTGDVAIQQHTDQIRFTLITTGGYVGYITDAHWHVIAMQSRPPVTVSAFYIPDPAEEGTPDSTNLAISLFTPGVPQAEKAIAAIGKPRGAAPVTTDSRNGWTIYRQDAYQGETLYTILDAKAAKGDVICGVRLAWPHLKGHDSDYDAKMQSLFDALLSSVSGGVGAYEIHKDEIVRRPDPE